MITIWNIVNTARKSSSTLMAEENDNRVGRVSLRERRQMRRVSPKSTNTGKAVREA
jgi:hypothetical protein